MAIFPQAKKPAKKKLASAAGKGPQRSFPSEGKQPKRKRKLRREPIDPNTFLPGTPSGIVIVPDAGIDPKMEIKVRPPRRYWDV